MLIFLLVTLVAADPASDQLLEYARAHTNQTLVSQLGAALDSNTASLTVGRMGPILLQDDKLITNLARFSRERIPERTVHAKGAGAFGRFIVTDDITKYTKATVFSEVGKETRLAVRFSTVNGEKGSPDTVREPRGLAIKFYTDGGNLDLLTLSTPVFFVRDPALYPSLIHAEKKNPVTNLKDRNMFWDFVTLRPENTHELMQVFSDIGIPDGYRYMSAFAINTFKLVNKDDEVFLAKFHFRPDLGNRYLASDVAENLTATDPDYSTRDLYNAIARKQYPSYTMYIQIMTQEQASKFRWNPFDSTKLWPEDEVSLKKVGKMELTQNPQNFFSDVEQIAYSPSNLIPGIEPSVDRLFQGRSFIYSDTQRHRLGANFEQLPVNYPSGINRSVTNYFRDGPSSIYNQEGAPNFYPNSFNGPEPDRSAAESLFYISDTVGRYDNGDEDNFSQPTMLWDKLQSDERSRLVNNIVLDLSTAAKFIQERAVNMFKNVSQDLADRIAQGLQYSSMEATN